MAETMVEAEGCDSTISEGAAGVATVACVGGVATGATWNPKF